MIFCRLLLLFVFLTSTAQAQEYTLAGAIDSKHTLHLFLVLKGEKAEVVYFYDRIGMPIALEGSVAGGKIVVENSSERFAGGFDGKFFTGTWTDKRRRHDMPFALQPADTQLATMTGQFKCQAQRSSAQGSVEIPLALHMKAGMVSHFSIESRVMPHAHTCNPDHSKLRQTMRGGTLTLTGIADPSAPCAMNLRRAGPFIHIANTGGACLCGARASIPDVLLDTRNTTCRVAQ